MVRCNMLRCNYRTATWFYAALQQRHAAMQLLQCNIVQCNMTQCFTWNNATRCIVSRETWQTLCCNAA